jgi:hypothetical protein
MEIIGILVLIGYGATLLRMAEKMHEREKKPPARRTGPNIIDAEELVIPGNQDLADHLTRGAQSG